MRAWLLGLLMVLCPTVGWAEENIIRLPQGTPLTVHAAYDISSGRVHEGDTVFFVVNNPLVMQGVVLIPQGARARGTVTHARHASGLGQSGELRFTVDSVEAVDGSTVRLSATQNKRGGNNTVLAVGGAVFVNVFALFIQGREAVVHADRMFDVFVNEDKNFCVRPGRGPVAMSAGVEAVPTQPQPAYQQQVEPQTPAAPQPPTQPSSPEAGQVSRAVMCSQIGEDGKPQGIQSRFTEGAPIAFWFEVPVAQQDRTYEVRWYRGNDMVATSQAPVAAGAITGGSIFDNGVSAGDWQAVLLLNGQFLTMQTFRVVNQ